MKQDKIEIRGLRQNNLKNVSLDIPKGKIGECIRTLKKIELQAPIHMGDVVAENVCGTGINVVATRTVDKL